MIFQREKQAIKRATVRFFDFVKSLVSRGAPVATVEPVVTSEVTADPLLAELDAMLAELLVEDAAQPSPVPAAEPEPTPAPIATTTTPSAADLEIEALLNSLVEDATTPAAAKSSVNSDAGNGENPQATPAFPAHGAAGCLVRDKTLSAPHPTKPSKPTSLQELIASIKASQSPLEHLFPKKWDARKNAGQTFRKSLFLPMTPWGRTLESNKFDHAFRMAQQNLGVSFTLNFSARVEASLRRSNDPAHDLADKITKSMRAVMGGVALPYAFKLEISPTGKLHAHGVSCLRAPTKAELDLLWSALVKAGGKVANKSRARQVDLDELWNADGWTTYFGKTTDDTIAQLGTNKITHVSRSLNAMAKQDWTDRTVPAPERRAA